MKCLVVTAHPLENSLCKSLTQSVVEKLTALDYEVTLEDLYADDFQPVLTVVERKSYYGEKYDTTAVGSNIARLKEAELLVLIFPTWWFGFPAILKGWFDRVWVPNHAYDHASDFGPIKPKLDNLREVLVVTTLGSPWWVDRLIMWQPVKRIIKIALLATCAKKSKLTFLSLYKCENINSEKVIAFQKRIEKVLEGYKKTRN